MEPEVSESRINIQSLPQVTEAKNNTVIFTSLAVVAIGIIALIIGATQKSLSSGISIALIVTGVIFVIAGGIMLAAKRKQLVYEVTGSPARSNSYYFNRSQLEHMKTLLAHGGFGIGNPIEISSNGNIKMDVVLSNDKRFAAVQIFEYVPFEYLPATKPYYFNEVQATDFANFLERCPKVS